MRRVGGWLRCRLEQVLASLETRRPYGLRDRAIVLSLATLGLRPGEVAGLCLDDIDWREGTVRLRRRKTRRGAVLPLPREAGRAIVAYLREERSTCAGRRVFVQHRGPGRGRPVSAGAVSEVVARALRRAHVDAPIAGAYVFRHTVASRMRGENRLVDQEIRQDRPPLSPDQDPGRPGDDHRRRPCP